MIFSQLHRAADGGDHVPTVFVRTAVGGDGVAQFPIVEDANQQAVRTLATRGILPDSVAPKDS